MRFSEKWLYEWVSQSMATSALLETLTNLGLEVDSVTPAAEDFSGVVVAEVLACQQHPDADRLSLCQVSTGDGDPISVVCGAPNVRTGLKIAFVKVGGVLPGNFKIKKAKLRGVASYGMICSARELGLGEDSDGIIELPEGAPVGMDFRDYYQLDDSIIDIELTPNRGDCASLRGIAREIAAKQALFLDEPKVAAVKAAAEQCFAVSVAENVQCPRYIGRVVRNVNMQAKVPHWLQERLRRSGLRSLNPVIDITNFVMLEYGQPMHAYDLDKLEACMTVRAATENENVTLLDGQEVSLPAGTLVVADAKQVQAVAGVMGASISAVSDITTTIFIESAYFQPEAVAKSARALGLSTDSSYRFERGVDFKLQRTAIERFSQLLHEICGGEFTDMCEQVAPNHLPQLPEIELRRDQISRLLGITIDDTKVEAILSGLGMQLAQSPQGWLVTPPSYRFDVRLEVDLLEELARLIGYNELPTSVMQAGLQMLPQTESQLPLLPVQKKLAGLGYCEAVTYSFVDPQIQQYFLNGNHPLKLVNPIATDMSEMRVSLWPGLVKALKYNLNRQAQRVRLFETGLCFLQSSDKLIQVNKIAGLIAGNVHTLQWGVQPREVDFFDLKGDLTHFLNSLGLQCLSWKPSDHPSLHPGQSAVICIGDKKVGLAGKLHPTCVAELGLSTAPYLFELEADSLLTFSPSQYLKIAKFPAVRRDIAIVVDSSVSAEIIERTVRQFSGSLLLELNLFDIYQGEGVELGKKSVALGLTFQDPERTLQDDNINQIIACVVKGLKQTLNASMRA